MKTDSEIKKRAGPKADVRVGILHGATWGDGGPNTGKRIAPIALYQEYGTADIPSRPFFRNTINANKGAWKKILAKAMRRYQGDTLKAFTVLGEIASKDVQMTIEKGSFEALNEKTVKAKRKKGRAKPSQPLIDTGGMERAISYEVQV